MTWRTPNDLHVDHVTGEVLYDLEDGLREALHAVAKERARIQGEFERSVLCAAMGGQGAVVDREPGEIDYWHEALPQAFFDLMKRFQQSSVIPAAVQYLRNKGYTVTPPEEEK